MNLDKNIWKFQKLEGDFIQNIESLDSINILEGETVTIPHTWYRDGEIYKGTCLYQTSFELNDIGEKRIIIEFLAVDRFAKIFVNNKYVGYHMGGYSAFSFDITKYTREKINQLDILVDNRDFGVISPLAGDFTVCGGIYRDVNIYVKDNACFDKTYYGTSGLILKSSLIENVGCISLEPHILGYNESIKITYEIFDQDNILIKSVESNENSINISVESPNIWNGFENPYLYKLVANLYDRGVIVDSISLNFGFKEVKVTPDHGFYLNHKNIKLNGVAKHQDQGSKYIVSTYDDLINNMEDIKDIGANSVRLSHYQHPCEMYDLCDKEGLIVWAEIPMLRLTNNEGLFENAKSQMKELILQNIHHVSIAFWGIQNEIAMFGESEYMYEKMKNLNQLVHDLDDTRISSCANLNVVKNNSMLNQITDAVGYNIYYGWYYGNMEDNKTFLDTFHKENPNICLGITEYGVDCNTNYHSTKPKVRDYTEDYQALYHETVYPYFKNAEFLFGTYIWNLYDFSSEIRDEGGIKYQNTKGIITRDHIKKDAFYYYKSQWSKIPFVKIAQKRFKNRNSETITIKVYSNMKKVTLSINNSKEVTLESTTGVFLFENINLENGINLVVATIGTETDSAEFVKVDKADESYVFKDVSIGINVKNWFTDLVEEEKLFPKDRYSIRDGADVIVASDDAMAVIDECAPKLGMALRTRTSTMSVERILSHMKGVLTDEESRNLNKKLTEIKKK